MRNNIVIFILALALNCNASNDAHLKKEDLMRGLDSIYPQMIGNVEQTLIFNPTLVTVKGETAYKDRSKITLVYPVAVSANGLNGFVGRGSVELHAVLHVSKPLWFLRF